MANIKTILGVVMAATAAVTVMSPLLTGAELYRGEAQGMPNCDITCGNMSVPYPFGMGPDRCYWPGFNLTCDRTSNLPRLLLGDGTLQVQDFSLMSTFVTVIRTGDVKVDGNGEGTLGGGLTTNGPYTIFSNQLLRTDAPASADAMQVPFRLDWEVVGHGAECSNVCKSKHIECRKGNRGYTCSCKNGYKGNPYITEGCTGGRKSLSIIGIYLVIGVAVGAGIMLFVLAGSFAHKNFKHQRAQMLKQKFFGKNRGQLLQQLVSQRADITERMIITLDELEKATNKFDKARELGGGGHGTVYKGILSDLHVVAIKKPKAAIQKEIDEFINEVAILSQINHRNVVKLYGCCLETEVPMLVYEFISNGTLYDHLHVDGPRSLSWNDRLRIATETARSLAYLHSTTSVPIIHRDIKSVNILLDDTLTAKVADFGASRYVPMDRSGITTRVQGTRGYVDPMCFYTGRLTEKSDVYSFGVLLLELLTRKKPFSYISSENEGLVTHFSTLFTQGNLSEILDPQVMEEGGREMEEVAALAAICIALRGEDRPSMKHVEIKLECTQASRGHEGGNVINGPRTADGSGSKELSRQYSMEEEFMLSSRYPR